MRGFVDDIGRFVLGVTSRGAQVSVMVMTAEAENVILAALTKEPCPAEVDFIPELRIHSVPVRVSEKMPRGRIWYVIKGGKQ